MKNAAGQIPLNQDYEIKQDQKQNHDLEIKQETYLPNNETYQIPRRSSSRMWLPTYIVFFAVVIFIAESGIIFIYTSIGLMKINPAPIILPAPVFPYQCPLQFGQSSPGLVISSAPGTTPVAVITQTVFQTVTVSPSFQENELPSATFAATYPKQEIPPDTMLFNASSTLSNTTAITPSPSSSSNVVTALVVITTRLPQSSIIRPTITVIEVIPASSS